jgi:hypothetical protein
MGLGSGIRKKPIPDPGVKKGPDPDPQHCLSGTGCSILCFTSAIQISEIVKKIENNRGTGTMHLFL